MNTIVIEVSGGVVQEVYAKEGTRVVLVNWDEKDEENSEYFVGTLNPLPLTVMPDEAEAFIQSTIDGTRHDAN